MMFSIVTLLIVALSPVISLGVAYFIFILCEAKLGIKNDNGLGIKEPLPNPNPKKSEVL